LGINRFCQLTIALIAVLAHAFPAELTFKPGNPDRTNIAFRAGTGGLHSAEN
jgi:hypothetical protein